MKTFLPRVAITVAFVNVGFSMTLRWNVPTTDLTEDWVVVAIMNLHILLLGTCALFAASLWLKGKARLLGLSCHGVSLILYAAVGAWYLWGVRPGF